MPLFEYDEGHLIPAQFGRTVVDGLTDDILKSVREQVLEIVGRPLFPITWQDSGPIGTQNGTPRLTALDASGQVVSVEVLERLDSQAMIDSLSRLADSASLGWNDLAAAYPGGMQGFRNGWTEFRDSMPPSPAPGPRLVLVAGSISDSVRPALDVLASSGVEVHEIAVRAMSNGRKFIDVQAVGPRLYGHNPNLLLGHSVNTLELESFSKDEISAPQEERAYDPWDGETDETTAHTEPVHTEPADAEDLSNHAEEAPGESLGHETEQELPAHAAEAVAEDSAADSVEGAFEGEAANAFEGSNEDAVEGGAEDFDARSEADAVEGMPEATADAVEAEAQAATPVETAPVETAVEEAAPEATAPVESVEEERDEYAEEPSAESQVPQLSKNAEALEVIAGIVGEPTPLIWAGPGRTRQATLSPTGVISTNFWSTKDPNEAAAMITGSSEYDGWEYWHLADLKGPSLLESLVEINREIRVEYENLGQPKRGRRSR
ncbi:MAG: hypothetical protein Q4E01_04920 [Actinomycetaceae bacterium]|nr:hypothetical protein [Actinomycetaceae bacterium]